MKLTVGHNEIVKGIALYLESQGMTAFSGDQVKAVFTQSRKNNGELSAILDNDPREDDEEVETAEPVAKTKPTAGAQASANKGAENNVAEAQKQPDLAPVAEASTAAAEVAPEAPAVAAATDTTGAAGAEENLFG